MEKNIKPKINQLNLKSNIDKKCVPKKILNHPFTASNPRKLYQRYTFLVDGEKINYYLLNGKIYDIHINEVGNYTKENNNYICILY